MPLFNAAPGLRKSWDKDKYKENRLRSCWDEFSNKQEDDLNSVPNANDRTKIPETALHYVKSDGKAIESTIALVEGLVEDGKGGLQAAEGSGETVNSLFTKVHHNDSCKVINASTKGVENKAFDWMGLEKETRGKLHNWMVEDKDYSCQRALIEGGDRYITENEYWIDNNNQKTAPHEKAIHPNIAFPGMTDEPTRSKVYDTDMNNIVSQLADLDTNVVFNMQALEGLVDYASRLKPLNMKSGNNVIDYVALLSPVQARNLTRDPEWRDLMKGAEQRGPDNRAISGILGRYQGVLLIEDRRSPILNLETKKFEYVTPMEARKMGFYGQGMLNRKPKGAAGQATGSIEVARILGMGTLGCVQVNGYTFEEESKNFKKYIELEISVTRGYNRLDFTGKNKKGVDVLKNISSGLYFTSTSAINY